jgi:aspartate/methionine/tyrosine aminotransferase
MHISLAFLNEGVGSDSKPRLPNLYFCDNLVGAVPVYYDLKEGTNWEPDFESLEKLDLTKVKIMWIAIRMPTEAAHEKRTKTPTTFCHGMNQA